jgi:hypothetical protein
MTTTGISFKVGGTVKARAQAKWPVIIFHDMI